MRRLGMALGTVLLLLLLAGYLLALHSRRIYPEKAMTLLGQYVLTPGAPAAFRLVGFDLLRQVFLPVSNVKLWLSAAGVRKELLAEMHPDRPVVDLNVRIPAWQPGEAALQVEYSCPDGCGTFEVPVKLGEGGPSPLRLESTAAELARPTVLITRVPGASEVAPGPAVRFQVFPQGGRVSSSFPARLLLRVSDTEGRPLAGNLKIGDGDPVDLDSNGFARVTLSERRRPGRLEVSYQGQQAAASGEVWLREEPAQIDLAVAPALAAPGQTLAIEARTLSDSGTLHLDAWWRRGWILSSTLDVVGGKATANLLLPDSIEGPVVVRVRDDPFGQGKAVRQVAVLAAARAPETKEQALQALRDLPEDPAFWAEMSGLSPQGAGLEALLSRVKAPEGSLPELADNRAAEEASAAAKRKAVATAGLTMAGAASALAWLLLGLLLVPAAARGGKPKRGAMLGFAALALLVVAFGLGAGFAWLCLFVG